MSEATIGTTNRDGDVQVMDTAWDSNGAHRVTVRDSKGVGNSIYTPKQELRRARALARRVDPRPQDVQWTRLDSTFIADGCLHYRFTVSRLDSSYR